MKAARVTTTKQGDIKLIVGLGNPGPEYERTRHNAGFLVIDALATEAGLTFKRGVHGLYAPWGARQLYKPQTFMNRSGTAVQSAMRYRRLAAPQLLLVHDDLDLPLGRLRLKRGGGAGGQRGVADTIKHIGPDFYRLKVGISRPPPQFAVERWVLSRFSEAEKPLVTKVIAAASKAVALLIAEGFERAAQETNGLELHLPEP